MGLGAFGLGFVLKICVPGTLKPDAPQAKEPSPNAADDLDKA